MKENFSREIETCSIQEDGLLNEDALILNESLQIYGVVDGATSLTAYRNIAGLTGGYLAAQNVTAYCRGMKEQQSLEEVAIEANAALQDQMLAEGIDTADSSALWSAACVVARIHPYQIEYIQAGDCMLVCKYKDGSIRVLTHTQVAHVDQLTQNVVEELRAQGVSDPAEIRQRLIPRLQANRKKANTLEGYGVMNGSPNFPLFLEKGTINRANLQSIYMVSDGLFTGFKDWPDLIENIDKYSLSGFAEYILEQEQEDGQRTKYPRLKGSDDKTGLVIHFD